MNVLGIHDGHNAAAALVRDGRIVAAIQEERLSRIKNHDTFPARAVERVLQMAGLAPRDLDAIALNGRHQPRHRTREQLMAAVREAGEESLGARLRQLARNSPINSLFRGLRKQEREEECAAAGLPRDRLTFVNHHEAHAAAACWGAPFRKSGEPLLVLTCDGAGDDLCATVSLARDGRLERLFEIAEEHSIGMVYLTVTQILGMVPNEHEYKLMGLAPYAKGEAVDRCLEVFNALMEFEPGGAPRWRRRAGVPHAFGMYRHLRDALEGCRFDAIAGAVQRWTEAMLCEWVRRAVAATGVSRVALSGGVFMNVKANKTILELPEVTHLFVVPSCGDESNAFGAALAAWGAVHPKASEACSIPPLGPVYWGEAFDTDALQRAVAEAGTGLSIETLDDPAERVADLLARGEIVARFDGPSEFGARALGNRSILADPSRPELVRELNEAIKNRDFWMPFAATVVCERAGDYVVNPKDVAAPYMILAFDTTARRQEIRAAIHPCDFTVRPQVLDKAANPAFHAVVRAFEARTGCGALLNTSFNLHGHPMVYSPADALDVFRRSGLRRMALGRFLLSKPCA